MNEIGKIRSEAGVEPQSTVASAFVARVGERVRLARERRGVTRKALSELSHISQRYLAQLEAGEGNISIALLHRVATALDCRVEWLVSDSAPEGHDIAALFASASEDQRRRALQILDAGGREEPRRQRVALIGLRGAGKSTLGRIAGESLCMPFLELNREIEAQSGMAAPDVMALYGQEGYRRLERQALERVVATTERVILAVAGGIVAEPETYPLLLGRFHTIWLAATPEEHMRRVRAQGDERPMAGNPQAMDELNAILKQREALYARAKAKVDTAGKTLEESERDLVAAIRGLGIV